MSQVTRVDADSATTVNNVVNVDVGDLVREARAVAQQAREVQLLPSICEPLPLCFSWWGAFVVHAAILHADDMPNVSPLGALLQGPVWLALQASLLWLGYHVMARGKDLNARLVRVPTLLVALAVAAPYAALSAWHSVAWPWCPETLVTYQPGHGSGSLAVPCAIVVFALGRYLTLVRKAA